MARALDWNPERRYQTASKFLEAIEPQRSRLKTTVIVAIFLALLTAAVIYRIQAQQTQQHFNETSARDSAENGSLKKTIEEFQVLPPSEQLRQMKIRYDRLLTGATFGNDVDLLEKQAKFFAEKFPTDPFADGVKRIGNCLGTMKTNGRVKLSVVKLDEYTHFRDRTVRYAIRIGDRAILPEMKLKFNTSKDIHDQVSEAVSWRPDGMVIIELNCDEKDSHGSLSLPLASKEVLQNEPSEHACLTGDGKFKLTFKIDRIGFDVLPPWPQQ